MRSLTKGPARRVYLRCMRSCLQGSRFRQVVHPIKEKKCEKTVRHMVGAVGQSHRLRKEANVVEPIAESSRPWGLTLAELIQNLTTATTLTFSGSRASYSLHCQMEMCSCVYHRPGSYDVPASITLGFPSRMSRICVKEFATKAEQVREPLGRTGICLPCPERCWMFTLRRGVKASTGMAARSN